MKLCFYIYFLLVFFIIIDIIVCFFSCYENDKGVLVKDLKMIIINYLKGWFFLDLLTSIPYEKFIKTGFFLLFIDDSVNIAKFAKLPRLYRLLNLTKMFKLL